jgi:hypothetical protein
MAVTSFSTRENVQLDLEPAFDRDRFNLIENRACTQCSYSVIRGLFVQLFKTAFRSNRRSAILNGGARLGRCVSVSPG